MLHNLFFFVFALPFLLGKELDVSLFTLFPLEFPGENGYKNDNEQERQQEDAGIEVGRTAHHFGPFIPSGEKIKPNGDNKQECYRNTQEKLPESLLLLFAVDSPVVDKGLFFFIEHAGLVLMQLE
jgi:hypothetical protein